MSNNIQLQTLLTMILLTIHNKRKERSNEKIFKNSFSSFICNLTAFADNIQIQDVPNPNANTGESIYKLRNKL